MKSNEESLLYAFEKFATSSGGKFIPQGKAIYDILGTIFKIGTMKAQVLYARCKMSVSNETGNFEAYKKLKFVEFLDLLCRVTEYIFKEKSTFKLPFFKQLEYIID